MKLAHPEPMKISAILPYFGGKRTMASLIVSEICQHGKRPEAFWELCCGSMAVSLEMPRCSHHHVVDMNDDLLNLARVIQDPKDGPELYRRLRRTMCHEGIFYEARERIASDDTATLSPIDRAELYFIVSWMGRNGVAGTARSTYQPTIRWTSGGGHGATRFANAVDSLPAFRRRMREWTIVQRDIFEVLAKIEDQRGTAIYIDPPYVRDAKTRASAAKYLHEFADDDHARLADSLKRFQKARVVVSYYDTPVVRELYSGWTFVDCMTQKNLHVQNQRGVGRCEAPEILIINGESYTSNSIFNILKGNNQ